MTKFEVGKRYGENAVVFEVIKRTAKRITYVAVHHPGRYNESKREPKTAKIHEWERGEVFYTTNWETVTSYE